MRVCLYTETALPKLGGQELVVDALARQFRARGHEVTVLAPASTEPWRACDRQLPYRVVRHPRFLSTRHGVSWYGYFLRRCFRRHPFDVLHCHSVYPCGYLAAVARQALNVPVVITSHGGDIREGNVRIVKPGLRERHELGIRQADALVAISQFTADGFARLGARTEQIVRIPNGVDLAALTSAASDDFASRPASEIVPASGSYALFLGRLHHRKGLDLLLQALAEPVLSGIPDVRFVIAGDGPERENLHRQAAALRLSERLSFVGPVRGEEKARLLRHARFVVMPSRHWEAFPLVVLEAYAAGKPVVGTVIPGLADLVRPGQTGLLVAPESPSELACALAAAWKDEARCRCWGQAARAWAREFDWPLVAERYLQLFARLADNMKLRCTAA